MAKLPLHLESMHYDEQEIIHLKNVRGKERQEKLAFLRNLGMSRFNKTLPAKRRDSIAQPGGLQVRYKPKKKNKSHLDYRECPGCRGMYCKTTLWKHQRRCSLCSPSKKGANKSKIIAIESLKATSTTKELLQKLHIDEISDVIINDKLIMRYAERLAGKPSNVACASRSPLQELSRIEYNMRRVMKIPDLDLMSYINPVVDTKLVNCIKKEKPSYKLRVGHASIHLSKVDKNDS